MDWVAIDTMDSTAFEEFCFGLLDEMGFVNIDWRKGTGLNASPADRGRDIVAELERTDVDGARHFEKWFVDCKHYKQGVPPEKLQGLLAWAQAERPHTALVISSNFLSNPAKDYIDTYVEKNHPPFRIKYWERPTLERLTRDRSDFLARWLLTGMRSESEILEAEQEFFDRLWHERHLALLYEHETGEKSLPEEILKVALDAAERVNARRPDLRPVKGEYEWGVWNGKLSALRWVLGSEWDFLDT